MEKNNEKIDIEIKKGPSIFDDKEKNYKIEKDPFDQKFT